MAHAAGIIACYWMRQPGHTHVRHSEGASHTAGSRDPRYSQGAVRLRSHTHLANWELRAARWAASLSRRSESPSSPLATWREQPQTSQAAVFCPLAGMIWAGLGTGTLAPTFAGSKSPS